MNEPETPNFFIVILDSNETSVLGMGGFDRPPTVLEFEKYIKKAKKDIKNIKDKKIMVLSTQQVAGMLGE